MSPRDATTESTTVLVVEDDKEFLDATLTLLRSEGYAPIAAATGAEAIAILTRAPVQVMLVMQGGDCDAFLQQVRVLSRTIQIVKVIGHRSEVPSRSSLKAHQILGFCDKSEGSERLLLWTDVARKAAHALARLDDSRRDLEMVLTATASMHRVRDKVGLYAEVLGCVSHLVPAEGAVLALFPDALGEDGDLLIEETTGVVARVVAGTGTLSHAHDFARVLGKSGLGTVRRSMLARYSCSEPPWVSLPLRVGEHILGFLALKVTSSCRVEQETLDVFAHQASVAIQNALYYEMAALDPLTGVHARRFFEVWTRREVRAALRSGAPLGLMMLDMDGLKAINDQGGHRAGDTAIAGVGRVLREATREHDLAARLGGDEFVMLMPSTDLEGANAVARRVLELLSAGSVPIQGRAVGLRASIGVAALQFGGPCPSAVGRSLPSGFFEEVVERLIRLADASLYEAKRKGGGRVCSGESIDISWGAGRTSGLFSAEEFA
jgi:diguanylate cyclase (GGDEF)-like protein